MDARVIIDKVKESIPEIVEFQTAHIKALWGDFLALHPADIAQGLSELDKEDCEKLILKLPKKLRMQVFQHVSDSLKMLMLSLLDDKERADILNTTPADELSDLFEILSDEELKHYLMLLNYHDQQKVLSIMQFPPQSAAGIMDADVITFRDNFTVERAIHILQRLGPKRELHHQIYVLNSQNQLVGYINLEDLVLKNPKMRLSSFMHKNELVAYATEDRESVAKKMIHYNQMTVPVVGDNNIFLGLIPSQTLVEIIGDEASEDVYHMSAMAALPRGYFETSFFRLLYERSYILILLLLLQTFSTKIIQYYEALLAGFLTAFITMLTSTGGNSSSQTSALVIQGMATGELTGNNIGKFLKREIFIASLMALFLGFFSFLRVYYTYKGSTVIIGAKSMSVFMSSIAVSISLAAIVFFSVILGSCVPLILKRFRIDPAFAAGPFLATLMDIFGLLLYCYISSLILS